MTWQDVGLAAPWLRVRRDPSYQGRPREPRTFLLGLCGAIAGTVNKTDGGVTGARRAFRYGVSGVRKVW